MKNNLWIGGYKYRVPINRRHINGYKESQICSCLRESVSIKNNPSVILAVTNTLVSIPINILSENIYKSIYLSIYLLLMSQVSYFDITYSFQ